MATTRFEMVTPTQTLFSGDAEMVVCRTVDGEIAFLADHMAYIGVLDPCVVRVVNADSPELRFAARGGFVEVTDNVVIMLADVALASSEIDVEAARRDEAGDPEEPDLLWAQIRLEAAEAGSR